MVAYNSPFGYAHASYAQDEIDRLNGKMRQITDGSESMQEDAGSTEAQGPAATVDMNKATGTTSSAGGNLPPITINAERTHVHNANGTRTFSFKNTYKVLLDNNNDIEMSPTNVYNWWPQAAKTDAEFKVGPRYIPIYDHNGQNRNNIMSNRTLYVPIPWKVVPTITNDNYLTSSDWNYMLEDGWEAGRILAKQVRINGLYSMHNYEESDRATVQNQQNPYIEFCSPKGQFFKHEHYRIDDIPDTFTSTNNTIYQNVNPIAMNALPNFKANPQDIEAMGITNMRTGLDRYDYANTLLNYYYPTWTLDNQNEPATWTIEQTIARRKDYSYNWYPDLTRTQEIHMTDLVDDYVHNVPVCNDWVTFSEYTQFIRPGAFAVIQNPTAGTPTRCNVDWRTHCANHIDFVENVGPSDVKLRQKEISSNYPPLLCRIPNHPNTGQTAINNKCYMYITYEILIECKKIRKNEHVTRSYYPLPQTISPINYDWVIPKYNSLNSGITQATNITAWPLNLEYCLTGRVRDVNYSYWHDNSVARFVNISGDVTISRPQRHKVRKWDAEIDMVAGRVKPNTANCKKGNQEFFVPGQAFLGMEDTNNNYFT
jgi:hypothetical protein